MYKDIFQHSSKFERLGFTDEKAYWALHKMYTADGLSIPVGDNVEPTNWAIENEELKPGQRGTVYGRARDGQSIYVLLDGAKTPIRYWAGYWKKAEVETVDTSGEEL